MSLKRDLKKSSIAEIKRTDGYSWFISYAPRQQFHLDQRCYGGRVTSEYSHIRLRQPLERLKNEAYSRMMTGLISSPAAERELMIYGHTAHMVVMDEGAVGKIEVKHIPVEQWRQKRGRKF